jgi:hypothetical protein
MLDKNWGATTKNYSGSFILIVSCAPVNILQAVTLAAIAIEIPTEEYVYRFQRTTHGLCTENFGKVTRDLQAEFTPAWMGALGYLFVLLEITIAVLVFQSFGWIWAGLWVVFALFGILLVNVVSPIPTYPHCMNIVANSLRKDFVQATKRRDVDGMERITELFKALKTSREKHGV